MPEKMAGPFLQLSADIALFLIDQIVLDWKGTIDVESLTSYISRPTTAKLLG